MLLTELTIHFCSQTNSIFILLSLSPLLCNLSLSLSLSSPAYRTMECVDGALEILQLSPQLCFRDNGCFNYQNLPTSDDFFVDQLLDFSNDDQFVQDQTPDEDEHDHDHDDSVSLSGREIHQNSIVSDHPSLPSGELTVPVLFLSFSPVFLTELRGLFF